MAAAIWIGTNIVQMVLSKPNANVIGATRQKGDFQKVGKVFKPLVDLCIIVMIATGAIIVFNRLERVQGFHYLLIYHERGRKT